MVPLPSVSLSPWWAPCNPHFPRRPFKTFRSVSEPIVSAPPLHVFFSPVSAPEAGPEHMCPHKPTGAQASRLYPCSQRRFWQGSAQAWGLCSPQRLWGVRCSGPGHTRPEESLLGWCTGCQDPPGPWRLWWGSAQAHWDPCGQRRPWRGRAQTWDPSRLTGARVGGRDPDLRGGWAHSGVPTAQGGQASGWGRALQWRPCPLLTT